MSDLQSLRAEGVYSTVLLVGDEIWEKLGEGSWSWARDVARVFVVYGLTHHHPSTPPSPPRLIPEEKENNVVSVV